MKNLLGPTYDEVLRVVRNAKRRWRLGVGLKGGLILLAFGLVAFAVSAWGMDFFLYSERSILWFRIFTYTTLIALLVRFLVLPLRQRVSDERVALYIEEHEPSLQAALLSALEAGRTLEQPAPSGEPRVSPALTRELIASVIEKCREIDYGQKIEQSRLRRFSAALAGLASAGMLAILLSPAFLQHGALLLFFPWRAEADNPYRILVSPGNSEVPRGADVEVLAELVGFAEIQVEIAVRTGAAGEWQRWPMSRSERGGEPAVASAPPNVHDFILLNLQDTTEYYVEAASVRSPLYRIDVNDLPYVKQINLEYRFPAYTGLQPRREEDTGDIAALRGTRVIVEIQPTLAVDGGRVLLDEERSIEVTPNESGVLLATLDVERPGYYRVELRGFDGELHRASSEYSIQVLDDQPPLVRFKQPGRDVRAHKIDEVFVEVEAEDDYGLGQVELVYSITGAPEQVTPLLTGGGERKVTAGHTFFLEEAALEEGDFISYYARARDTRGVGGRQLATSDIYFIEIRPFGKNYRRQEGGGMGQGGGGMDNSLSLTQREIIAATFKLIRDRREYGAKDYAENLSAVALMQGRLREQVETLVRRMENRATVMADDDFQKIMTALQQAGEHMVPAEEKLMGRQPDAALPDEQQALKFLQRAEAVFRDVRVSFDPGGGGGGGGQMLSDDLADLFELELDKLRNQYETVQRGERQQLEQEIDEALQRLRELARRQQQENERARRGLPASASGSGSQDRLIEETEELARKLERLARERSQPELQESARRLREAADSMRQASSSRSDRSVGEGVAALDRLREARRLLDRNRRQEFGQELEEIEQRAQRMSELQERITSQVGELPSQQEAVATEEAARQYQERIERLFERKDQLGQDVAGLESELDRMARQAREEHPEASRQLQEAANSIRDNQLKEKIRYSKGVARGREQDYAQMFEREIGGDLEELVEKLGEARAAAGSSAPQQQEDALERARELVQSLESLESRLRDRAYGRAGDPEHGEPSERAGEKNGKETGEESGEESGQEAAERGQQGGERSGSEGQQADSGEPGTESSEQAGRGRESAGLDRSPGSGRARGENQQDGEKTPDGQPSQDGASASAADFARIGPSWGQRFLPGTLSAEELRQYQRELSERLRQGNQLRDELREQGLEVQDLDEILRQISRLDVRKINNDPLALDQLREQVVEGMRQFEYRLWRDLSAAGEEKLYLTTSDQVPTGYRELVEEYYRSLSSQ